MKSSQYLLTHGVGLHPHKEAQFLLQVLHFSYVYCIQIMHNMFSYIK